MTPYLLMTRKDIQLQAGKYNVFAALNKENSKTGDASVFLLP